MAKINFNVNVCDRIANELIIHLTKECPNSCSFCIDKLNGYKQHGSPNFERIKETFLEFKDRATCVTITGGEPLLYLEDVLDLVKFIRLNSSMEIGIDTSIPTKCYDNPDMFYELIENVDWILLSGHHYDKNKADIIRGSRSTFNREEFYKKIPHKDKFILSINVFKPHMCEREEILKTIMYFYDLGFNNIKLAELFEKPEMHVSIGQILGIKLKQPFAQGCSNKNVDISHLLPEFKGNLTIKTVCFIKSKNLNPNFWDLLKTIFRNLLKKKRYFFGVIHPNGKIYPYWI
jgi:pyruvate-formate lyase-activating enzyme